MIQLNKIVEMKFAVMLSLSKHCLMDIPGLIPMFFITFPLTFCQNRLFLLQKGTLVFRKGILVTTKGTLVFRKQTLVTTKGILVFGKRTTGYDKRNTPFRR
jgi:hypothetical protein